MIVVVFFPDEPRIILFILESNNYHHKNNIRNKWYKSNKLFASKHKYKSKICSFYFTVKILLISLYMVSFIYKCVLLIAKEKNKNSRKYKVINKYRNYSENKSTKMFDQIFE